VALSTTQLVLRPDSLIDLQLHTIHSDGTWTPEALLNYLTLEKFALAAITDHDRVDTALMLQQLAVERHLPVLVAAEMTTTWRGGVTDILCYGFDPHQNALAALTRDLLARQQDNTRYVYESLRRKGLRLEPLPIDPPVDELAVILAKPAAQQPHELIALVKRYGYANDDNAAWQHVGEAGVRFEANPIADVVDAAHQSGAVCLVAHPGRSDGFVCYDTALLDQLREEVPIDGLEVYYPVHTPEQTAMFLDYARQHHLLMSSGSDSHGPTKKPIPYNAGLSRALLERLGVHVR
jgi:3',5'-nucleoside bisphosphate phosphatase